MIGSSTDLTKPSWIAVASTVEVTDLVTDWVTIRDDGMFPPLYFSTRTAPFLTTMRLVDLRGDVNSYWAPDAKSRTEARCSGLQRTELKGRLGARVRVAPSTL